MDIFTKSETYQKEGWFILEEENQVLGKDAEAVDNNINLESEDFYFYNQNKEEAKKNIDSSSKDLTDFIDSLIQDVPYPSDEEVNTGIEKILKITHPEEQTKTVKTNTKKKVTFRVLFIAALLSILSVSCLFVVGSNHDISIENGFVSFAKDTIQIVFFGEDKEEYITVDALLTDLELHGYGDILFPQEFVNKSDEYKVSVPEYSIDELHNQVLFDICKQDVIYTVFVHKNDQMVKVIDYVDIENADTLYVNNTCVYIFDFDNGDYSVEFSYGDYYCSIKTNTDYSEMLKIITTLKKGK